MVSKPKKSQLLFLGSLVEGEGVDEPEELDTDLYRICPRRKGGGWEVYDVDEGRFVPKERRDLEEEARDQRTNFVLKELARRRRANEAAGSKVCLKCNQASKRRCLSSCYSM